MIKIIIDETKCKGPFVCGKCLGTCQNGVFLTYPKVRRKPKVPAKNWVIIPALRSQCVGCNECTKICPNSAIEIRI